MSFGKVVRGSLWLSMGAMAANLSGFLYWMLVSPMVSPSIVGKAATVLAIESLILSMLSLGIPVGVVRFLGIAQGKRDNAMLVRYFYSVLVFMFILYSSTAFTMLTLGNLQLIHPDRELMLFASIFIFLSLQGWPLVIISFFNSTLRTEKVSLIQVLAGVIRLAVGVPLVYLGLDFYGVMLGYVVASLTSDILLLLFVVREIRELHAEYSISLRAIKDSLEAGVATWIPSAFALSGQWFGIVGLNLVGYYGTGIYFIAYSITVGLLAFPANMLNLMYPVLSGMVDGRKRSMGRAVKIASTFTFPLIFVLVAYPAVIPSMLGEKYLSASTPIMILSSGFLLAPLVNGYTYYAYAVGKYGEVAAIGLAGNVPRLILYLILIPSFSETGAAVSYTIGFLTSLLCVIVLSRRADYHLDLMTFLKILVIPLCAYFIAMLLKPPPMLGISMILFSSVLSYLRLKIIGKDDLRDIATAILSKNVLNSISPYVTPILRILYGD